VREQVVRDMHDEISALAWEGLSVKEIGEQVNGHRDLSEAEQELIDLLTYHAVAEVRGRYEP
jgi:hypothetical protein